MRCGMVRAQAGAEDRGLSPVRTSNVGTSNLGVGVGEEVPSFYFLSLSLTLSLSARPRVLVPVSYAPAGHEGASPSVFVQVIYSPVAPFTEERPCPGNIRSPSARVPVRFWTRNS